jgi:hypothetical protein
MLTILSTFIITCAWYRHFIITCKQKQNDCENDLF